eukprot:CAMPEP_0181323704 /NCGR_PEP_ID=MMETSP1101-20121128/19942_1 /TAXON_ID=46948 /ORGANISM="Rhodomonas abbreviata, Strain Caron Lab Isolate" /LENGTH=107 /DNA_ID=CAMNT_0023431779 /DNA_START=438 /DNA_END=759 /DNA_ORIENTATION=-
MAQRGDDAHSQHGIPVAKEIGEENILAPSIWVARWPCLGESMDDQPKRGSRILVLSGQGVQTLETNRGKQHDVTCFMFLLAMLRKRCGDESKEGMAADSALVGIVAR